GGNDGQKTMGVIALAIYAFHGNTGAFVIDTWVKVVCALAIGLGTATGGWRIIRTMGMRITALKPVNGFAAETSAATVIEIATRFGIPISTTHAISGAILGVGATRRLSAVRWGIAGRIVTAWVLTIPGCFILGYGTATLLRAAGAHPQRRFDRYGARARPHPLCASVLATSASGAAAATRSARRRRATPADARARGRRLRQDHGACAIRGPPARVRAADGVADAAARRRGPPRSGRGPGRGPAARQSGLWRAAHVVSGSRQPSRAASRPA